MIVIQLCKKNFPILDQNDWIKVNEIERTRTKICS